MVCHVFHEQPRLGVFRLTEEQFPHDGVAVAIHSRYDVVTAGMLGACYPQVVAVQRLVYNGHVLVLRETVHQRSRNITWS